MDTRKVLFKLSKTESNPLFKPWSTYQNKQNTTNLLRDKNYFQKRQICWHFMRFCIMEEQKGIKEEEGKV